jgi:dTDP-4-dehydrorhamnose reductase
MNILVTGANGQLGTEMRNVSALSKDRYVFTDVNSVEGCETLLLDITDLSALCEIASKEEISVIINCAAFTNVDAAEDNPSLADLLNHKAASNLAQIAKERNATLIHISTDYVFQGNRPTPCMEDWPTEPLGVYGKTKLAGEQSIIASGCKYIMFRTAWLYSPYGKNFVKTMRKLTSEKDNIKVVFDQVGTPTYAADLADVIYKIISERLLDRQGIYHYSNEGVISWYDFAKAICELSGNNCDIQPCHSDEFPSKVQRPSFSVLDKTKIKKVFGITVPYWRDSLVKCINRM